MKNFILFVFTVSIIFSCTNVSEDDLIDVIEPPLVVTYNADIKIIIDNNCLNCHISPPINGANIPLLIFENVKNGVENNNLINRISKQAGESGAMPFGGPRLPQNLIDLLIQWEADGLLEN
ncbi:hypothetical protein EB822_03480 [Flavobacteriaceae bacterium PRS1]|nr:hypothetical protein EB822_03480 [Flavobacteriaceae bacterium PRS1]